MSADPPPHPSPAAATPALEPPAIMSVAPETPAIGTATATFAAARYATWLVAPLAVVCLFAKVHKLLGTPGGDVGSALAALFFDVLFIAAFWLVTWSILRSARGPVRTVARVVLHVATFVVTLLMFVEHGFWLTTGTLLDSYTLGYGLEHIGALGKVYLSEMGLAVWLGFALLLAVHYLPIRAMRIWAQRRRVDPPRAAPLGMAPIALLAALPACTCVAALAVDIAPPMAPLTDNVVLELTADALSEEVESAPPSASPAAAADDELVLAEAAAPSDPASSPRRNVIIIIMESLRSRSTSLHDATLDTTPFLSALAERGAMVETAWTSVTHTSKAIVGVLCGIYPRLDLPIDEAEPTGLPPSCLARILRERGYATAFMQTATAHFERRDQLVRNMRYETFESKETIPQRDFEETSYFGWEDEAVVAPAVAWAGARVKDKTPFFLTLLTLSTHHTYQTPTRFEKRKRASGELDDYLNAVSYLDATLAKLFDELGAAGALDDTLVVLVGDHGEGFGEHQRRQHDAVIYEEGLHVPLVLLGPGVRPGTRIGGLRHSVDIVPTVLEWLGTPVASGLPGLSLLDSDGHPYLLGSCWLRERCIATRDATMKFIWHFDRRGPELFDLAADPLERKDLLATTPETVWGPMKERALAWHRENHARWARFFSEAAQEFVTTLPPLTARELDLTFSGPLDPTFPADPTAPADDDDGAAAATRPFARLIGVDVASTRVVSGDPIRVTLAWEVLDHAGAWTPFSHLLGKSAGTRPRFNADHTPVNGRHPTSAWIPGTFVSDAFRIQPKDPLPPGRYELVIGFWNPSGPGGAAGRAEVHAGSADGSFTIDDQRGVQLLEIEVTPRAP